MLLLHADRPGTEVGIVEVLLPVEDHDAFRQALAHALEQEPGIGVIGQARTLEEARRVAMERIDDIDVVVTDLLLPDGMGVDLVRRLHRERPDLPALAVTVLREREVHEWVREMGTAEVLAKDRPLEDVIAAVRKLGGA